MAEVSADAALSSIVVEYLNPASLPALSPFVPMPRSRAFSDTVVGDMQEAALLEEARGTIVAARGLLASS